MATPIPIQPIEVGELTGTRDLGAAVPIRSGVCQIVDSPLTGKWSVRGRGGYRLMVSIVTAPIHVSVTIPVCRASADGHRTGIVSLRRLHSLQSTVTVMLRMVSNQGEM